MRLFAACLALFALSGALPSMAFAQAPKKPAADKRGVSAPGKAAKAMNDGRAYFDAGDFSSARKQWGKLREDDPGFKAAQGHRALTLYGLKRDKEFLKQADLLDAMTTMTLKPAMKEELGWKYIEAAHRLNDFEAVVARQEAFEAQYPDSPRRAELREYKMNALFKRGIKAAREAALAGDGPKAQARRDAARLQLMEFENMALSGMAVPAMDDRGTGVPAAVESGASPPSGGASSGYAFVKNQNLADQLAEARLTLGGEGAALADASALSVPDREKLDFLKIQVHQRLHADAIDQEIEMLQDYITGHPNARQVNRAYIDLQSALFKRGEKAFKAADEASKTNDTDKAAGLRDASHKDFEQMRILMEGAAIDPSVGVTSSEILDIHKDWLYSYWLEKDYTEMLALAQRLAKQFPECSLVWAEAKLYEGMGHLHIRPQAKDKAIAAFDAALSIGLKNKKESDQIFSTAATWRIAWFKSPEDREIAETLKAKMGSIEADKLVAAAFFKSINSNRSQQEK